MGVGLKFVGMFKVACRAILFVSYRHNSIFNNYQQSASMIPSSVIVVVTPICLR